MAPNKKALGASSGGHFTLKSWRARRDSNPRPSDPKLEGFGPILSVKQAPTGRNVAISVAISATIRALRSRTDNT
jgi:hypothetical protein